MSKDYIVIADSIPTRSKRFRVIQGGWKEVLNKRQTINETIDGGLDICLGTIYKIEQYVFRLAETEANTDYGTKADLEYFFKLNNPVPSVGQPSNLLTIIDNYETTMHGFMVGNLVPDPLTTIISGEYAWFMTPIEIRIKPE
jgi:hypothetical protein